MKKVLIALALLWPSLASAQIAPYPLGITPPIFGLPASAVNGGGGFTGQLLGPESCTVPAYSFITAPTNGWGGSGTTTICGVVGGTQRLGVTSTAVTSTVPYLAPDGTVGAPGVAFASDPDTGIFHDAVPNTFIATAGGSVSTRFGANTLGIESNTAQLRWGAGADASINYEAAATLQMGVDAAGVTDQMFKGPDRITSDGVGGNLTIAGGRNRGASVGGATIFQASPAAGAGVTGTLAEVARVTSFGISLAATPALAIAITAPTAAGTGMAFTVGTGSTSFDWSITITTANAQSVFTLTLPTATNAWTCVAQSFTNPGSMKISMSARSTTTAALTQYSQTTGLAAAYADANVIVGTCTAH